jgi:hypothetical protein
MTIKEYRFVDGPDDELDEVDLEIKRSLERLTRYQKNARENPIPKVELPNELRKGDDE